MSELETQTPDIEALINANPVDELQQISDLLEGKEPEKAQDADTPEKEEVTSEQPEVAEKAELDYGLEVPMTDGTKVTLGELKDHFQNHSAALLDLSDRTNALAKDKAEVETFFQYLDQYPPEMLERAKAQAQKDYATQTELLRELLPESRTPAGQKEIKLAIYKLGEDYGLKREAIDGVRDAVTIQMMHDFAKLRASIREAKANVKPLRSASPNGTHAANQSDVQTLTAKAKQTRSGTDEARAVDALLRRA
jgi:hypothetical protein